MSKDMYRVMVLHSEADVVEGLINQLRSEGLVLRSSLVDDFNTLISELTASAWDLILVQMPHENIALSDVIDHLKAVDKHIPVLAWIQTHDAEAIVEILQKGVAQVLTDDLRPAFGLIIERELIQAREHRALRHVEMDRHEIEKRCLLLLESSRDAIAYIADGMHIFANGVYLRRFGFQDMDELSGIPLMDLIAPDSQAAFKKISKQFNNHQSQPQTTELQCVGVDGEEFAAELVFSSAHYEGESCVQLMLRPLQMQEEKAPTPQTDHRAVTLAISDKIKELSKLDVTTGLFNHFYFEQELQEAIGLSVKESHTYALFYLQLSGYNKIRAKIGVEGIDQVGREMADILRGALSQQGTLARFSEDVYAILWQQGNVDAIIQLAAKLCKAVESHLFDLQDQTVRFTASIGIALLNESIQTPKELIARAMQAVEWIEKEQASNGYRIYVKPTHGGEVAPKVTSAQELQKAFEDNLFKIFFQPIINLRGSSTEYYEVLLRRVNEQGGFESPEAFLKTASASKIASIVDRWVIIQSVKALIARRAQGHTTRILINLTAQSLQDKAFIPWLGVALKSTRLPKESVTFQVNEEDAVTHLKRVQELAGSLQILGCHFAVSRFGYSENSMAMLKHVNLNYVKLDGFFTKNIHREDIKDQFNELVQLLHQDNIKSIAPQVESANVLSVLWQVGVDYIQGYYLQPPMEGMNYDFSNEEASEEA